MRIFPAIDIFDGKCVRLYKGDYDRMTVYGDCPADTARELERQGAEYLHIVDLQGARDGTNPSLNTVQDIRRATSAFIELGGGIRSIHTVDKYLSAGVDRVIIGTAAVTDEDFLREALRKYADKIAVGIDLRDGFVSIRGWTEQSEYTASEFCKRMCDLGVSTIICTDISRDGAMHGANTELYRTLSRSVSADIIASGGVSGIGDIRVLRSLNLYGAIIGKAYYTGAIDIAQALEEAK